MSEMAETADHLVVIGRGRLLADASVAEVIGTAALETVAVRSPEAVRLAEVIVRAGGSAVTVDGAELVVSAMSAAQVGDLAAAHGIALHELSPRRPSLEAAFLELTRTAVEYGSAS